MNHHRNLIAPFATLVIASLVASTIADTKDASSNAGARSSATVARASMPRSPSTRMVSHYYYDFSSLIP